MLFVSPERVDKVMKLISELSVQQGLSRKCTKLIHEIQSCAFELRLQPLSVLFRRLDSLSNELAQQTQSNVSLEYDGGEIELDITLIDGIADFFLELIRTAAGHTQIFAKHHAECVVVTFHLKKLSSAEVTLVTTMARSALDPIGGSIQIVCDEQARSVVVASIPSDARFVECLLVGTGGQRHAVPVRSLDEVIDLTEHGFDATNSERTMAHVRGHVLQVVDLESALSQSKTSSKGDGAPIAQGDKRRRPALVARDGADCLVIRVDEIFSQLQIMVRPLNRKLAKNPFLSGTAMLGSGETGFVLNISNLIRQAKENTSKREQR